MHPKTPSQQTGFSLLEILVAFAILALSLGVLLNIFSSGLRSAMLAEEYQEALAIAESQLAKVGVETEVEAANASGVELDKYTWNVSVSPLKMQFAQAQGAAAQTPPPPVNGFQPPPGQGLVPFSVQVSVTWQEGADNRELVLNSVRLSRSKV